MRTIKNRFLSLSLVLFCLCCGLKAQDFSVLSVEHLPKDMSAREDIKTDEQGRQCALFRIATRNIPSELKEGFYFSCDYTSSIVEKVLHRGEIWIWVSPGIKTLKIMHKTLGQWELQTTNHISNVVSLHVYKIVIQGTAKQTEFQLNSDEQYLEFAITPTEARLFVDNEPWSLEDGMAKRVVKQGKHHYRVEATDYHDDKGELLVDASSYTKMKVDLKPAFGFLRIENASLTGGSIYIDNATDVKAYQDSIMIKLSSGQHQLRLTHPFYPPFTSTVIIKDEQTATLRPKVNTTFVTLDFAHGFAPQNSFGFTFGSTTNIGWFVTAASNFSFEALNHDINRYETEDGTLFEEDGNYYYYPDFTGESSTSRLSVMAGMVFRIADPVYMKIGAGYGARVKAWRIAQGDLVTVLPESYSTNGFVNEGKGFDATVGLQLNLKYLSIGMDAVMGMFAKRPSSTGLNTEFKIGIGYNWKKLK